METAYQQNKKQKTTKWKKKEKKKKREKLCTSLTRHQIHLTIWILRSQLASHPTCKAQTQECQCLLFPFLYLETRIESTAHRHCVVTTPPFQKPSPSHCAHSWQPSLSKYMHDVIFQSRIGRRFGVGAEGGAGDEKVRRHEKVDGVNRICFGRGFLLGDVIGFL